jgi:hypothetical protein
MCEFESSEVSQAVPLPEVPPLKEQKSPLLAAFCDSTPVSELPKLTNRDANSAKISGE